jgi:hypothetical protein
MWFKVQAFAIIGCGVGIAASIVWSVCLLFAHSAPLGIVGCVVLAGSGAVTHRVLG